jgi:PAS domain-containing protein
MRTRIPLDWLDIIPLPIFILDRSGKVWHANPSLLRALRIRKNALLGKRIDVLLKGKDNHQLLKDILNLYRGNAIVQRTYRVSFGDMRAKNVTLDLTPIQHPSQNRVEYVFGMMHELERPRETSLLKKLFGK